MRKKFKVLTPIIAVFMVLILSVGLSFAQTREATWGFKNSNNVYRLTATRDTAGAHVAVSATGVGWSPAAEVFTVSGAVNRLDATDSGRRLIDASTYGSKFILPNAVPPLEIELCTGSLHGSTLDTNLITDTIHFTIAGAALAAGDSLLSPGQSGDCVRVTAGSEGNWYVTGMTSVTWTDNGTN